MHLRASVFRCFQNDSQNIIKRIWPNLCARSIRGPVTLEPQIFNYFCRDLIAAQFSLDQEKTPANLKFAHGNSLCEVWRPGEDAVCLVRHEIVFWSLLLSCLVRIHVCIDPNFCLVVPSDCDCSSIIRPKRASTIWPKSARKLVKSGEAVWELRTDGLQPGIILGKVVTNHGKKIYPRQMGLAAQSVGTRSNIERAYGNKRKSEELNDDAENIEIYQELTQENRSELLDLPAPAPADLFVEIIEMLPGESLAELHQRTPLQSTHLLRPSRREVVRHLYQAGVRPLTGEDNRAFEDEVARIELEHWRKNDKTFSFGVHKVSS